MRIWLLLAIAFVLSACSSTEPTVKPDQTMVYPTITKPRTASPQNFYRSPIYSGTQPRAVPPRNFYRSPIYSSNQRRPSLSQNYYRSPIYSSNQRQLSLSQNYYRPPFYSSNQRQLSLSQNNSRPPIYSSNQQRPQLSQNYYRTASYSGTQAQADLSGNNYRPSIYPSTQARDDLSQNFYGSAIYSGAFQKPAELEPAVEFWRKTYTLWHLSEVVFHDDRYLDVIYEVMELPGYVDESLTSEQKEIIDQRRDFWKVQLSVLESKLRSNLPFNTDDMKIIAKLENNGRQLSSILYGASDRVRSQRGNRERFMQGLEISRRYEQQFRRIFREAGLPEDLAYLPHVESSFQPAARSSAGAVGMWQFTKAAAKTFIPAGKGFDRRLDPFASAIGAARYLSYAYSKLGDWPSAITSYNHGIYGMMRAQDEVGHDFVRIVETYDGPAFGFASRNYYAQFLAAREIARNPMQYFPERSAMRISAEPSQYLTTE